MIWECRITATTHDYRGKRHRICRWMEAAGDLEGAVERTLAAQPRKWQWLWYGVVFHVLTPLGQKAEFIVDPDTRRAQGATKH